MDKEDVTFEHLNVLEGLNEDVKDEPGFSGIAFCPVCSSNIDVAGTGLQILDCNHCGQRFAMTVSKGRFDEFNIY